MRVVAILGSVPTPPSYHLHRQLSIFQKDPRLFDANETPDAHPEGPARDAFVQELKDKTKFYGGEAYEQSRTPAEKEAFTYALHETME